MVVQQALKYLLQCYNKNVRFCLICNYISRIDESLQNEFMRLRFNQLPKNNIIKFISNISDNEKLELSNETLESIQQLYKSDIRSMINYMQSNDININERKIIKQELWKDITKKIITNNSEVVVKYMKDMSIEYNIEKKNLLKNYLNYLIRYHDKIVTNEFLKFVEYVMHISDININYLLPYAIIHLKKYNWCIFSYKL